MYLLLPSLEEKRFIHLSVVSQTEAINFANRFTDDVKAMRKLKGAVDGGADDSITFYSNFIDLSIVATSEDNVQMGNAGTDDYEVLGSLIEAIRTLAISEVQGVRGARVIFVDPKTNTVGVGTTVVYNKNWATLNFEQPNILGLIENTFLMCDLINIDNTLTDEPNLDEDSSWY